MMKPRELSAPEASKALRRFTRLPGLARYESVHSSAADRDFLVPLVAGGGGAIALGILLAWVLGVANPLIGGLPGLLLLIAVLFGWPALTPLGSPTPGVTPLPAAPAGQAYPGDLPSVPGYAWSVGQLEDEWVPSPDDPSSSGIGPATTLTLRAEAGSQARVLELVIASWTTDHEPRVFTRSTPEGTQVWLVVRGQQRPSAGEAVLTAAAQFLRASASLTRFPATIPVPTSTETQPLDYHRDGQTVTVSGTRIPLTDEASAELALHQAVASEWLRRRLLQQLTTWDGTTDPAQTEAHELDRQRRRDAAVRDEMATLAEQRLLRRPLTGPDTDSQQ
ncbi:hypothetical protein M3C16_010775 [Micrococcus luteus]|nr:hypothetical protein [Micrococcus luteus]